MMRNKSVLLVSVMVALASVGCAHSSATGAAPTATTAEHVACACNGLEEAELSRPLLEEATDVHRLTEFVGKQRREVTRGVSFRVPARRGESAEYLERVVTCRIARADGGPLAVEGVRSDVVPTHGGYEIRLTTHDPAKGREIARRAEILVASNGSTASSSHASVGAPRAASAGGSYHLAR